MPCHVHIQPGVIGKACLVGAVGIHHIYFQVAYMLYRKGASIRNIFIYLGAFSSMKIPMIGVEIGYLGIAFSLARTLVSLPLFIGIGYLMEWYLKNRCFEIRDGSQEREVTL